MADIVVLGSGGFGLSLAVMAQHYGHNVAVWSAFEDEIEAIKRDGENKKKLPGVKIPDSISFISNLNVLEMNDDDTIVIFGIPSSFTRNVAKQAAPYLEKGIVLNTAKGLEDGTFKRMSQVLSEEIPNLPVAVLSGPSHAEEVARGIPTTVAVASENRAAANYIQEVLSNKTFRIYVNDDVTGCELGGSLKNIIALCAGICDGLGYGDNTKAALMTRGISEIARLGYAMGANIHTFSGLTGIGDLIVTCTSMHSRNRRAGILIGQGISPDEAVKQTGTVEGYSCCKVAYELSRRLNVDMPITEQLYKVLYEYSNVREALWNLMGRPHRHETEELFF